MTTDDIRKVAEYKKWDITKKGRTIGVNWHKGTWVEFTILFNAEVEFSQTINHVTGACERSLRTQQRFTKMFKDLLKEIEKPKLLFIPQEESQYHNLSANWGWVRVNGVVEGAMTENLAKLLDANMEGLSNG